MCNICFNEKCSLNFHNGRLRVDLVLPIPKIILKYSNFNGLTMYYDLEINARVKLKHL